jgi:sugar phosphate permease
MERTPPGGGARFLFATMPNVTAPADVLSRMRRLRWTAFCLVAAAFILSFFHRIAPAAIAGELREDFQASGAALGALAATYFYVYTVMQIPTGVLADTLGPRRIVALGNVLAGIGSLWFALAATLPQAAAGRALVGLGVSVAFIALLKLNAAWFRDREFATLTGLTMLMGNLGAVLSAAPLAWAATVTSWRNVFVGVGVLSLALALFTWFLVRDDPREAGLPTLRELDGLRPHPPHGGHWMEGLAQVVRNRLSWPGFFVNFGMGGTFLAFAGLWAVPFLVQAHGMARNVAAWHTSALLVAFAFSAFAVGALSDRFGRRKPVLLGLGFLYLLCWLPWIAGVRFPLWASIGLFGVMGICAAGFTVSWASAKEVNPPALSGMATSLVNTGVFLGPALYQPLVGWVLDRAAPAAGAYPPEAFRPALLVLLGFSALGLASALGVRETYGRNIAHP